MSKLTKYLVGIAATAAILFVVWYFSNIVVYILVSAVLAIIGKPMVDFLSKVKIKRFHIPNSLAAAITLIMIWAVAILVVAIFIPLVFNKISELSRLDIPYIVESFRKPLQELEEFIWRSFSLSKDDFSLVDEISGQLYGLFNMNLIQNALSSVMSVIGNTLIAIFSITFITFFFLKEDKLFLNMLILIFPKKYEQNVINALESINRLLIRYFTGILAESTIITILLSCIFMLWGFSVDTAFFMGLVVGVLNVIPYIGPIIGACVCIIVGILSPMDGHSILRMALIIGGSVVFVQGIDNFVLQPVLYSRRVNAHPLEIFIVILIAGSVAGVLGMLLAIPAYNVIRVFAKEFFNNFRFVRKLTEKI